MSEPIQMPGHGIDPEGGNTIGRTFDGGEDGDGDGGESTFDAELVNLTNVLYVDRDTPATVQTGNIERPFALLQDAVDAAGVAWTLILAPVAHEPGCTVPVTVSGIVFMGLGDSTTGKPSIDGMELVGGPTVFLDRLSFTAAIQGTGSVNATKCSLPTINVTGGLTTDDGCQAGGNITTGAAATIKNTTFNGEVNIDIGGDLMIDLFSMNSLRSIGANLTVAGATIFLDAPTVIGELSTITGEDEIIDLSVPFPTALPGDTFAASATGLDAHMGVLAPRCAVAGTVIVPIACIGLAATASVTPTVTLLPVATPDEPPP